MRSVLGSLLDRGGGPRNAVARRRMSFAPSLLGTSVNGDRLMRAMGEVSTLFAIIDRLATSTASVEWNLYRKAPSGEKKDRTLVTKHPALDLWRKPNRFYTGQRFVHTIQQHEELVGESAWVIVKAGRLPVEMWPVRPDRLEPIPDRDKFLAGYRYYGGGESVPLDVDQVIRPMSPHPMDPYRGLGPVQALLTHLDAARYSAEWNRSFFLNGAEPGGIIEVSQGLDDDEFGKFRDRWAEQHQGVSNAHRVAMLEEGMKWVDRVYSNRDMQFVELNGIGREIIREAYGFPKSMLGAVEDVNRANAEAGEVVFGRWLVVPRLDRKKDHLNNELLPMYYRPGEVVDLEFDYVAPVPEDRAADNEALTAQANAFKTLIEAGVDPEYAAAHVGMPPGAMDGGQDDADGEADPRNIVEMVQKVYLGVGVVLTAEEAREILNRAGANLGELEPGALVGRTATGSTRGGGVPDDQQPPPSEPPASGPPDPAAEPADPEEP
jgi:HK97 family phage portal protein